MTSNDKYYIPKPEEFVQGFKFQILYRKKGDRTGGIFFIDEEYNKKHGKYFYAKEDVWIDKKVWWKRKPKDVTFEYEGITVTTKDFVPGFDTPYYAKEDILIKYLKDGKIRARK